MPRNMSFSLTTDQMRSRTKTVTRRRGYCEGCNAKLNERQWRKTRQQVLRDRGTTCEYCGCDCSDDPTIDHVVPFSRGGSSDASNLVVACRPCNSSKGDS